MPYMSWIWASSEELEQKEKVMRNDIPMSRSEMESLIEDLRIKPKYRDILRLRFLDCLTYEEIAECVDMSDRQVKRIVYKYGDMVLCRVPDVSGR